METPESNFIFIIPPYFDPEDLQKNKILPSFTTPYGVLSLITYLKKAISRRRMNFSILDLNVVLNEQAGATEDVCGFINGHIANHLSRGRFDFIGISALFNTSIKYLDDIAEISKKTQPNAILVAGGGLPSAAYPQLMLSGTKIDGICKGEGELPLERLLNSPDPRTFLDHDVSWVTKTSFEKGHVPQHSFIDELDKIPPLDYAYISTRNYNSRSIDKRHSSSLAKREFSIHTSRGCPFKCVFCSNPSLHGHDMRYMSVERVVSDAIRMRDEHGMNVLLIEDDHFFSDKSRAKKILAELSKLEIRCEFPNGVAVYAIDDEVACLLSRAGVSAVALAIESGSDFVLNKLMKKPLKTKSIKPAVDALRKHDIRAHAFIIAGIPGEQDEHRGETRKMLLDVGIDWAHIFCAIPIFGSKLFDICVENGYIDDKSKTMGTDSVITKCIIKAPGVDPKHITEYVYNLNLEVNFVENKNMKTGRYDIALPYFSNVVEKYPDHALGHYCYAMCRLHMGDMESYRRHFDICRAILNRDTYWKGIFAQFEIEIEQTALPAGVHSSSAPTPDRAEQAGESGPPSITALGEACLE